MTCAVRGRWVLCPCLCAALWAQKPVIFPDGVVNAATFAQKETRAQAIAPGSIVTIFGSNLARATAAATSFPLPKELGGTVVTFEDIAAPLFYVSPDQINVQVPGAFFGSYGGIVTRSSVAVRVSTQAGVSNPIDVDVSPQGIGIFTMGSTVCGRGAVFNVAPEGSISLNGPENSAAPGGVLTIFGTGLGAVSLSPLQGVALLPDGEPAPASPPAKAFQEIGFTVNRARVPGNGWPVLFAGRAPGLVGVDQVNVVLPESVPEGCSIPLQILSTYSAGQLIPISIRRGGGRCVDPLPDSGATVVWRKTVSSGVFPPPAEEALELDFSAAVGKRFTQPLGVRIGGCLLRTNAPDTPNCSGIPKCCDLYESRLDAGGVTAQPAGATELLYEPVLLQGRPSYTAVLPGDTVREGTFTVSGAGGADVGAFQSTVHIPAPIELTSSFPPGRNIASSRPFTVTWRGGAPDTLVRLRVISRLALRGQRPEPLVAECLAWASAGSITLPTVGTQFPSIGLPSSADAEIVVSVSAEGEQVQRFSARGLTLGGRHGWRYEFRFGGLTIQ